jgi:hypothetical protein
MAIAKEIKLKNDLKALKQDYDVLAKILGSVLKDHYGDNWQNVLLTYMKGCADENLRDPD